MLPDLSDINSNRAKQTGNVAGPHGRETDKEEVLTMKINYNMSAVVTNSQLLRTESNLTDSMERLSSGLRINHAKDDAAGMAISNKMKLQIDGLDQASRNASDGTSVLQTTDGALGEVTSIIQRMRELAVQAASDSNTQDDKTAAQQEIESLKDEIDRVSKDTEFNTKSLLDGTLDRRVYAKNVSRVSTSIYVQAGDYQVTVADAATKATTTADTAAFSSLTATIGAAGTIDINGSKVDISATDTYESVYEKIRDAGEIGEVSADIGTGADAGKLILTSSFYGDKTSMDVTISNSTLAAALGFSLQQPTAVSGTDATVELTSGFPDSATVSVDGNQVAVTDKNGFELSFLIADGYADAATPVDFDVTDIGTMTLQIGANENQTVDVKIPKIDTETLYLDDLDVTTVNGADKAIDRLDKALAKVSAVRSTIGAYTNRLDYAVGSLDETSENVTAALSRIEDVDMAEEMSEYTQQNVLQQAATSVLTQANDLPQQVLQLLQ